MPAAPARRAAQDRRVLRQPPRRRQAGGGAREGPLPGSRAAARWSARSPTRDVARQLELLEAAERGTDRSDAAMAARRPSSSASRTTPCCSSELARELPMSDETGSHAAKQARARIASGRAELVTSGARGAGWPTRRGHQPRRPRLRLQSYRTRAERRPWTSLVQLGRQRPPLSHRRSSTGGRAHARCDPTTLARGVPAGDLQRGGRDVESLGIAVVTLDPVREPVPPAGLSNEVFAEALLGSVRVLGQMRRFPATAMGAKSPPRAAARVLGGARRAARRRRGRAADASRPPGGTRHEEYLLEPGSAVPRVAGRRAWVCSTCRRQHLHGAAGVCTYCQRRRSNPESADPSRDDDYYAFLATRPAPRSGCTARS